MRRRIVLAVLAAALASPTWCLPSPCDDVALAGDKDKDKEKERKAQEERRKATFDAIAGEFVKKDADGLAARVPENAKVALKIGKLVDGSFARGEMKQVLTDKFFNNVRTIAFAKTSDKEKTEPGVYKLSVQVKDKTVDRILTITLGAADGNGVHPLVKLSVEEA